jgi:hypothetical protein
MTPMQSTALVLALGAAAGFVAASALLPGTAPTRMGAVCFWLARLLIAAGVAAVGLGILEVANSDLGSGDDGTGGDASRALLAQTMADVLFSGSLLGWGVVVQVIGMSSFAWRSFESATDEPTDQQAATSA